MFSIAGEQKVPEGHPQRLERSQKRIRDLAAEILQPTDSHAPIE
jgi:hypothetical protein